MQSDLNIYRLPEELLLDFEPGLTTTVSERLEKYVVSEDVQLTDVRPVYGLLSIQGPKAGSVIEATEEFAQIPQTPIAFATIPAPEGDIYLINRSRFGTGGYDLFLPLAAMPRFAERLLSAPATPCGWQAAETVRIEAGIPRYGLDMDESNLPLEAGLESSAISFNKGCYIGQEVVSRIKTYSEVAKALRGLRLPDGLTALPQKGEKLYANGKEVGYITSSAWSPRLKGNIAIGYVRKETNQIGAELVFQASGSEARAKIVKLPFVKSPV
jgi:folate-binding protein YgfZ